MKIVKGIRPFLGVAVLAALMVLAACGGGANDATPTAAPAAEAVAAESTAVPAEEAAAPGAIAPGTRAGDLAPADRNGMFSEAPEMVIDPSKFYYATLDTEQGEIRVQLFADRAPIAVNNFVFLAKEGFYDGTTFHRVLGWLHGAGWRPERHRRRRPGLHL